MSIRLTKFINSAALPVCLAAMDACWMYAVAWLFSTIVLSPFRTFPVPEPPVLAGLELAAWGLSLYLLDKTRLALGVVRGLVGVAGTLLSAGVAIALNPEIDVTQFGLWLGVASYSLVVSLVLWGVGGYRASQRQGYELAYGNFRLGLIALVLASLLAALVEKSSLDSVWGGVSGIALWFVVWSLCALTLSNREALRRETGNADPRFWGTLLAGSLVCVAVISLLSGAFTLGDLFGVIRQVIGTIVALVLLVVYWTLYAIFWLMSIFRLPLKPSKQAPTTAPPPPPQIDGSADWLRRIQEDWNKNLPVAMPPELQAILTALVAALLVGIAAWLVSRGMSRTRQNTVHDAAGDKRESLGSPWELLLAQLKAWFAWLWGRFRKVAPVPQAASEDDLSALEGRPEWASALSIRQIYSRLQVLAAQLGHPRTPQQTPTEYLATLTEAMPALRDDLAGITTAYMEARYGPPPVSSQAALTAANAWKRAEPALRKET